MSIKPMNFAAVTRDTPPRRFPAALCLALLALVFAPAVSNAQDQSATKRKETGTVVRMLCVQSLTEGEETVILATKTAEGEWKEHGTVMLRSQFITSWIQVPTGITHLLKREGEKMVSLGSFKVSEKLNQTILVLLPDTAKKIYRVSVIDPAELKFQKGKALILNYSKILAVVKLGGKEKTVKPGEQLVENIAPNSDRMYRMLVGYLNEEKKLVACYDRFLSSNPETRKFFILFPDPDRGLRVFSLSEFGPFK